MNKTLNTAGDVASAVVASLVAGCLIGGVIGLGLAGLLWTSTTTVATWGLWATIPAVLSGVVVAMYMLWQFFSGNVLAHEMWENLGKIFTRSGID